MPKTSKRKRSSLSSAEIAQKRKCSVKSESRTVLFVDFLILGSLINIFDCPKCKKSDCLTIGFSKNELLNFYLKIKCSKCSFTSGSWLLQENFNEVFIAAKTCAGITDQQTQRMIGMIGISGQTEAGEDRVPDFTSGSKTSSQIQKKIDNVIIKLATDSMLFYRNSFVKDSRRSSPKAINVSIDGTYNDNGM